MFYKRMSNEYTLRMKHNHMYPYFYYHFSKLRIKNTKTKYTDFTNLGKKDKVFTLELTVVLKEVKEYILFKI